MLKPEKNTIYCLFIAEKGVSQSFLKNTGKREMKKSGCPNERPVGWLLREWGQTRSILGTAVAMTERPGAGGGGSFQGVEKARNWRFGGVKRNLIPALA